MIWLHRRQHSSEQYMTSSWQYLQCNLGRQQHARELYGTVDQLQINALDSDFCYGIHDLA